MAAAKKRKLLFGILFMAYLVLLVYFLFFSEKFGRTGSNETYQYNLVIFQEIGRFIRYREIIGTTGFLINIFGNVVAFMPFGFFLPALFGRGQKLFLVVSESFLFSMCVEVIQLLTRRGSFDVDDLLLNTTGGLLGYLSFITIRFFYRKVYGIVKKRTKRKG